MGEEPERKRALRREIDPYEMASRLRLDLGREMSGPDVNPIGERKGIDGEHGAVHEPGPAVDHDAIGRVIDRTQVARGSSAPPHVETGAPDERIERVAARPAGSRRAEIEPCFEKLLRGSPRQVPAGLK